MNIDDHFHFMGIDDVLTIWNHLPHCWRPERTMTDQLNGDTHQTKVLLESQKLLLRLNELDAPILGHHVLNPKIGTVQSGIASPKEGYIQQSKVYAFICFKKKPPSMMVITIKFRNNCREHLGSWKKVFSGRIMFIPLFRGVCKIWNGCARGNACVSRKNMKKQTAKARRKFHRGSLQDP